LTARCGNGSLASAILIGFEQLSGKVEPANVAIRDLTMLEIGLDRCLVLQSGIEKFSESGHVLP